MRTAFHHIAYHHLDVCNALSWASLETALRQAGAGPHSRIADLGCAYARTSILMAETFGAEVTAVDLDRLMIEGAQQAIAASPARDRLHLHHQASIEALKAHGPFDTLVALGTTFPAGEGITEPKAVFSGLAQHIRPGGALIWGDLTWTAEPPAPLRQLVEASGYYVGHDDWQVAASEAGLKVVSARLSTPDEWAPYRETMQNDVADWLAAHEDHPDAYGIAQAAHRIRLMFEFGADCLGFGLYVLGKPA